MLTVPPPIVHAPAPQHLEPNILNMVSALSTPSFNLTSPGAATFFGGGVLQSEMGTGFIGPFLSETSLKSRNVR